MFPSPGPFWGSRTLQLCHLKPWREVVKGRLRYLLIDCPTDAAEEFVGLVSLWRGLSYMLPGDVFVALPFYKSYATAGIHDTWFGVFFFAVGLLKFVGLLLDHRDLRKLSGVLGVAGWLGLGFPIFLEHPYSNFAFWGWYLLFAFFNFAFAVRVRRVKVG